jgi:hypothetical protein
MTATENMADLNGGIGLQWRRKGRREYVLVSGDTVLAEMGFRFSLRGRADVEIGGSKYELERGTVLSHKAVIKSAQFGELLATVGLGHLRFGRIEFADGSVFRFRRDGWRGRRWSISDLQGQELLATDVPILWSKGAEVYLLEGHRDDPHTLHLIVILQYLVVRAIAQQYALTST